MTRESQELIDGLPGADLVLKGVADLGEGTRSAEALLVMIAAPALQRLGLALPAMPDLEQDAELALYRHLQKQDDGDAYSAYNALLRTITSFTRSLAQRRRVEG